MAIITQKRTWNRQSLIPTLITLAICYSLIYNYFLISAVHDELDDDASCAAVPSDDGSEAPHCSEVRLFRSWHDADAMAEESLTSLLAETVPEPEAVEHSSTASGKKEDTLLIQEDKAAAAEKRREEAAAAVEKRLLQRQHYFEEHAKEARAREERRAEEARLRQEKFDELEKQVRASLSQRSESSWAKHLQEDMKRMEEKSAELKRHHDDRKLKHWQADIDRLESKLQAALHTDANDSWVKELARLKGLLESHIGVNVSTPADHDEQVFALRHIQLDKLEEALHESSTSKSKEPWAKLGSLAFEVKHLRTRLELEMSSHKIGQHASPVEGADEHVQAKYAERMANDTGAAGEIANRATSLAASLNDLVSHHKDWESKLPTGTQAASGISSTTIKPAAFLEKRLQWSSVKKLSHSVVTGAAHDVKTLVSKSDLRHLHWEGTIPKVACITAISYSSYTKARMMYFIDNFKLQTYEGPKQLVLVYHHLDSRAAKLVQKYADGVDIKGVAARDGEKFPSNAALRYGAWSAGADVVARWEFDEWHDPKRLSMQVRAMAATSKPACLLQSTPATSGPTTAEDELSVQGTSLVGERSWMRAYWRPFREEETVPPPPAHLVLLSMSAPRPQENESHAGPQPKKDESQGQPVSNLRANATKVEVIPETNQTKQKAEEKAVHEWTMQECLDLDTNITGTLDTEAVLDKTLGHDMAQSFHKLSSKRHDISQRLVLLCIETTMRSDMQEHIFKRQHVEQMLGIRNELDKHLAALHSILAIPS